ncbi:MAG: DUF3570 domain-containing protein [Proteobacteria bacterium]|nr:DUF3570 domain-containing protein [Pseudomonadota bacterium]MCP4918777.1 DUF3570 domain-containing protein [Pseudomonadota bacterium]
MTLAAAALLAGGSAFASGQAGMGVDAYDDGLVRVWMPSLYATLGLGSWELAGSGTVDATSGATQVLRVDGVSSATTFSERRTGATLVATRSLSEDRRVGVSGTTSLEGDYRGLNGSVNAEAELWERTATLAVGAGGGAGKNLAEGADSMERTVTGQLGWTQILGPRSVLSGKFSGQHAWCDSGLGCNASPYRYVPLFDEDKPSIVVTERHPDLRTRGAVGLRYSHLTGSRAAVHASLAGSLDSWGVKGVTGRLAPGVMLADERLLVWGKARYTRQSGASFVPVTYTGDARSIPSHRSADRELQALSDWTLGGSGEWSFYGAGPFLRLGVELRADRMGFQYAEAPSVRSWLIGGGLNAEF